MSDPAEDAAQRAWERKYGSTNSPWREGFPNQVSRGFVDAAREMAKPIREWLDELRAMDVEVPMPVFLHLESLARLIYSSEELES